MEKPDPLRRFDRLTWSA